MIDRRAFLSALGSGVAASSLGCGFLKKGRSEKRKKIAVIATEWRNWSHVWHTSERFLVGYPVEGQWYHSPIELASVYMDQFPENDLSRSRSKEFGFPIYPTIAETLRCGGDKLAVDGVLLIGEHGNYPKNEIGQKLYPRYEFFKETVEVFKQDGRSVPVFNDKHLSWKWEWSKEMLDTARSMGFPFLAGSSLPLTWRLPSVEMPYGAEVEEVMCIAEGGIDSYDIHALETIQCMSERRKGGETGVSWLQAMQGESVWKAMEKGSFDKGGWDPQLFHSCLTRSHTLTQFEMVNHRYPKKKHMRQWVKNPIIYRFQHNDGLKVTMLLMNGLVKDFTFAARLKDESKPLSTLFYLSPVPNVVHFAALMSKFEEMVMTGKAPYPPERTLLTSGLVIAGVQSLAQGQKKMETPHLAINYQGPKNSHFLRS